MRQSPDSRRRSSTTVPQYANAERFPEAEAIYSESFEQAFEEIVPNENTYLVIVTRGHQEDENVLRWAVQTNARYIGMIGSKRKSPNDCPDTWRAKAFRANGWSVFSRRSVSISARCCRKKLLSRSWPKSIHHRRAGFKHPLSKKLYQTVHT